MAETKKKTKKKSPPKKRLSSTPPKVTAKMIAQAEVMASYGMKRKTIAEWFGLTSGAFYQLVNSNVALLKAMRQGNANCVRHAAEQLHQKVSEGDMGAIKFVLQARGMFNPTAAVDEPSDAPDTIPDKLPQDHNEAAKVYREIMFGGKNK